jgi:hypothetical protein
VFVPIDGVDFSPYATLLLTTVNGARIADRVVILTDGDTRSSRCATAYSACVSGVVRQFLQLKS